MRLLAVRLLLRMNFSINPAQMIVGRGSSWSEWESRGTDNIHLIQGLERGTDYAVRMRARNRVGPSRKTGIKIIKTLVKRQR